jgi:hypothetical protein
VRELRVVLGGRRDRNETRGEREDEDDARSHASFPVYGEDRGILTLLPEVDPHSGHPALKAFSLYTFPPGMNAGAPRATERKARSAGYLSEVLRRKVFQGAR